MKIIIPPEFFSGPIISSTVMCAELNVFVSSIAGKTSSKRLSAKNSYWSFQ